MTFATCLFVKNKIMTSKIIENIRSAKSSIIQLSTFAMLAVLLAGCGQDRNLNEYRNSQVELELNKYRSIQGSYRGLAYQVGAKKPLGAIEVQLFANTIVDTDGLRREPRPVLQAYVTLRIPDLSEIVVAMDSGFYLPQEGRLKTSANAVRSETTRTLQLEGDIKGTSINGLISVFGYPGTALEVDLDRSAEWPELKPTEFAHDRLPYVSARGRIIYAGKANYANGRTEKASLELRNNSVNSTGMLIDILSPVRIFTGIVDIQNTGLRFSFSNMAWDSEAGTLTGSQSRGGVENVVLKTECTDASTEKLEAWSCTYTSTLPASLHGFDFTRKRGPTQATP